MSSCFAWNICVMMQIWFYTILNGFKSCFFKILSLFPSHHEWILENLCNLPENSFTNSQTEHLIIFYVYEVSLLGWALYCSCHYQSMVESLQPNWHTAFDCHTRKEVVILWSNHFLTWIWNWFCLHCWFTSLERKLVM